MKARRSLAAVAVAGLMFSLAACGGADTTSNAVPQTPTSATAGTSVDETQVPTDFADSAARASLREVCDKLDPAMVADLLGLPDVKMEYDVIEAQDSLEVDRAQCVFDAPEAVNGAIEGEQDGQTFLDISIYGAAIDARDGGMQDVVAMPDGSTGYYGGADDTSLLVTPTGSDYELAFSVAVPSTGGTEYQTNDVIRTAAAEAAGGALD